MAEEAAVLSIACTQIACPVYAAALFGEKIPDKTAISGCELDEGKYHV